MFNAHGVAYFMSIGLDQVMAAACFSAYTFAAIPWNFLFGAISDKKSPGLAAAVNGVAFTIVTGLAFMWSGYVGAMIVAVFYAAGGTISVLAGSLLTTRLFGTREAGALVGTVRAFAAIGSIFGPLLAGFLFDTTQSYTMCFEIMAVFGIVIVVGTLYADGKGTRAKIEAEMAKMIKDKEQTESDKSAA